MSEMLVPEFSILVLWCNLAVRNFYGGFIGLTRTIGHYLRVLHIIGVLLDIYYDELVMGIEILY